jgi:dTDP-4-amino-4,6-dideoxygalactose transaminase
MTDREIPIADVELGDEEIEAAVEVLESGYLVQGEQVEQFEREFADYVGADHAIAVSSGTAALHVAYLATLTEGSDVLVPALSHVSTGSMVSYAGCNPIFCDVDNETFTFDVESARNRLTTDTEAIVPVHLFGNACDIGTVQDFADRHNLTIIWDSSQAHGTTYDGEDVGSFSDVATYSFYPTKNMTTTEGGMITTDDPEVAEECRLLRSHWQTEKYYHPNLGLNYRMTDVEAAIGRVQLEKLDDFISERRENAAVLNEQLGDIEGITTPVVSDKVKHSYYLYTVLLDTDQLGCTRSVFQEVLEEYGVGTAVHYPRPLHKQPGFGDIEVSLPVAEDACRRVLSLPIYPTLTDDELERVVDGVKAAVRSV